MSHPGLHDGRELKYTGTMNDKQNGRSKVRVLVFSDESLLSLGIETLLRGETLLETASCESDMGETLDRIRAFEPQVVILATYQQYGETASNWMRILKDAPGIKLLGLSLQDNTICIYRGDTQQMEEGADLLRAIEQAAE
jgi:DNA-binding NarL/FixJ family response regulator